MPVSASHGPRHTDSSRKSLDAFDAQLLLLDSFERGLWLLFCSLALLSAWCVVAVCYLVRISSASWRDQIVHSSSKHPLGNTSNVLKQSGIVDPATSQGSLGVVIGFRPRLRTHTPAGEIPLELWKIIFQYVVAGETPLSKFERSSKLASVSKYWRQIVLSYAEMWDVVAINLDCKVKSRLIRLVLTRSSAHPLHIYIFHRVGYPHLLRSSIDEECTRIRQAISILAPHIGRVMSLQIEVSCAHVVGLAVRQLTGVAASLKELSLVCHLSHMAGNPTDGGQGLPHLYIGTSWLPGFTTPQLENLTLTVACIGLPRTLSSLSMIRSLTLLYGVDSVPVELSLLLGTLALMKSLTFFKLDGSPGPVFELRLPNTNPPDAVYAFPSLRVLSLNTVPNDLLIYLLTHMRFPALEHLDITNLSNSIPLSRVFARLDTSDVAPVLYSLRVGHFGPGVLPAIFPHLGFCRTLVLHSAGTLDDTQLLILSAPQGLTAKWFCDNMISLEINDAPLISVEALRRLVLGRKTRSTGNHSVPALQTLTVFHEGRLAAQDIAWFKDSVRTFHWCPDTTMP